MAKKKPEGFLYYCSGNAVVGRGHVTRCLSLARGVRAIRPRAGAAFCGSYDAFSRRLLGSHGFASLPAPKDAAGLARVAARFGTLIVDTYLFKQRDIDALSGAPFKLVVIDDFRSLDLSRADLVVNFAAGAERRSYGAKAALGHRFIPLKPEFKRLRARNLRSPSAAPREAVVFLSGAKSASGPLTPLLRALDAVLGGARIRYVCDAPVRARFSGRNVVAHMKPDPAFERVLRSADLVVCGGGMVRYEAAYCALANASLGLNAGQDAETRELVRLGVTLSLGSSENFSEAGAARRLRRFLGDPAALRRQRAACRRAFDADSTLKLARRVAGA